MESFDKLIEEIKKEKELPLSSALTNIISIGSLISVLLLDYEILNLRDEIESYIFLIGASLLTLTILAVFQLLYASEAFLKGKILSLKRLFRKEIQIHVDSIMKIDSFGKHTIIKYSIGDETHSTLIISVNEISISDILKASQKL